MIFKAVLLHFAVILGAAFPLASSASAEPLQLVGFGDSLMAGYQLPPDDALPNRLQAALVAKGYDVAIANAGVSGDTTSAGLCPRRLVRTGWYCRRHPRTWRKRRPARYRAGRDRAETSNRSLAG